MNKGFLGLVALALVGCSSVPVDLTDAPAVPHERVFQKAFLEPGSDKGEVVFSVDSGMWVTFFLSVDGIRVAGIKSNEVVRLYVPQGRRVFQLEADHWVSTPFTVSDVVEPQAPPIKFRLVTATPHGGPRLIHDVR